MIELYYWNTPNGHKITIFLEEAKLKYNIYPVNITKNEQFKDTFLRNFPNNKIPAIIDFDPKISDSPIQLFESGVILEYLADKTEQFLPKLNDPKRYDVLKWLYWQVAGLGPMAGQNHHFGHYANEKIPYAINRYVTETTRLYKVLNKQLENNTFVAGKEYSIADMAIYPWIIPHQKQNQDLNDFPNVKKWFDIMRTRPAVISAYEKEKIISELTENSHADACQIKGK